MKQLQKLSAAPTHMVSSFWQVLVSDNYWRQAGWGLGCKAGGRRKKPAKSFPSPLQQSLPVVPHICPFLLSWHTSQLSTQKARIKICFTLPLQLGVATWLYSEESGQMQKPVSDRRRQTWPVFKTFCPFFSLLFFFKGVVLFIYFSPAVYSLYFSNPENIPREKQTTIS